MDRQQLRSQASSRRSEAEAEKPVSKASWDCHYCSRSFKMETAFMKHHCRERDRLDELRSPIGQAAFSYYNIWFKARRFSPQTIETFAEAKLYTTFIRFAKHVLATNLPDPEEFIKLMVNQSPAVPPVLWCADTTYSMYLQSYDAAVSPEKQVIRSIDELLDLAKDLECSPARVYGAMGTELLVTLIRKRKLTFWALLSSARFKAWLLKQPAMEKDVIVQAINVPAGASRMQQVSPHLLQDFAAAMNEAGL